MNDDKIKEAAQTLKAYFLQKRNDDWAKTLESWKSFASCQLGTCGDEIDGLKEEEKKEVLQKKQDDYTKALREVEHATIVIYKLQKLLEE